MRRPGIYIMRGDKSHQARPACPEDGPMVQGTTMVSIDSWIGLHELKRLIRRLNSFVLWMEYQQKQGEQK
jgi:hypothetical protein